MAKAVTTLDSLEYTPLEPSECGNYWITPDGKRMRPLTPKHKKFARLYVQGLSGAEAARRAGFTKHKYGAKVQGSALIRKNPLVVNEIIELLQKEREREAVSMESHLTELSRLRDEARDSGQVSAAISAEVSRGRAAGLYIEKKEVTLSKVETTSTEDLISSLKDLVSKANELKQVYDVQNREESLPVIEGEFTEGPLAKDRDGSASAGSA